MGAKAPKVTVLMPVYNGQRYLKEAIDSILDQTFKDLEFLIINDGSEDSSVEIIGGYSDERIRLVHNEKNLGLIASLNHGIRLARGEYIARMDCDDRSLPRRLKSQVEFMDRHRDVGVCGSWISIVDEKSRSTWHPPTDPDEINAFFFFDIAVAHPSVMMRTRYFLDNGLFFDPAFRHGEDYDLWTRALECFKFANIPEILLCYRRSPGQISRQYNDEQTGAAARVRLRQLQKLDIDPDKREIELHNSLMYARSTRSISNLEEFSRWLAKIRLANSRKKVYIEPYFSNKLKLRWFHSCYAAASRRNPTWRIFKNSALYDARLINRKDRLKFILKSNLMIW